MRAYPRESDFPFLGGRFIFKIIRWDDKDTYIENGDVDCLWGSFSMDGREDAYQWAGPYMTSKQCVLVRTDSDIYTLNDLNGKKVAVQATTKPEEIFLKRSASDGLSMNI